MKNNEGGFIEFIIIVIVALLILQYFDLTVSGVLAYFNLSLSGIMNWLKDLFQSVVR